MLFTNRSSSETVVIPVFPSWTLHSGVHPQSSVIQPLERPLLFLILVLPVLLRDHVRILLLQTVDASIEILVQGFRAGFVADADAPPVGGRQAPVVVVLVVALPAPSQADHHDYDDGDEDQGGHDAYQRPQDGCDVQEDRRAGCERELIDL